MKNAITLVVAGLSLAVPVAANAQDSSTGINAQDGSAAPTYEGNTPASNPMKQVPSDVKVSFGLSGATDYVWRGVSQSNNHAAVFATVNLTGHGFYAGAGTENVDFGGTNQEFDLWGGYVVNLGSAKLDVGAVRYGYVGAVGDIDTLEGKVALTGSVGKLNLGLAGYYTGNYFGSHHDAIYTELSGSYPILDKLSLSAAVAHQQISNAPDYNTWNMGLSYQLLKGAKFSARYVDTDINPSNRLSRARAVGTFSLAF